LYKVKFFQFSDGNFADHLFIGAAGQSAQLGKNKITELAIRIVVNYSGIATSKNSGACSLLL